MRAYWAFGCAIVLAGCVAPPVVTIATLALDGVSYFATGKGVGDHLLSAATHQDCALWHVVSEQDLAAVCRDYDGTEGTILVAADSPKRADDDSRYFAALTYREPAPVLQPIAFQPQLVAETPVLAKPPENRKAVYLVAGSFRQLDNAQQRAVRLSGSAVMVTTAAVHGEVFHRVVAGPFVGEDMMAARSRIVAAGIAEPWAINLCTSDLAPPPCVAPTTPTQPRMPLSVAAADAAPAGTTD